jgi:hypothetical protein
VSPQQDALENPLPGDHWQAGMGYHVMVVKVTARLVWTLEGRRGELLRSGEVHQWLREQFTARLRLGGRNDGSFRPSRDPGDRRNAPWAILYARAEPVEGWLERAIAARLPWHEHGKV